MTDSGRFQSAVDSLGRARVLAFLLLAGSALSAQEYSFRNYGNAEGLTNLAVQQIYQDHVGFIWVSTDNGIFRFDGERFEAFGQAQGVPSSSSVAFGDGPDGSLLVGGDFGLLRLQGNRFEKVPASFKKIETDQGIQTDGMGHTYLGSDAGLVELGSQPGQRAFSIHSFVPPAGASGPEVFGILADGNTLWFGCGTELCHRENGQTKVFGEDAGLPKSSITTIRKDGESNLWVAVKHGGLLVMPTGKSRFQRPDLPAKTLAVVNPPSVDSEGRILLPTSGGLLIREKEGWQSIDPSKGLRGGVYTALEDRQHSMWIGMVGRGLVKWRGYREWETYSTASGLISDVIWEMQTQTDGTLWVGTGEGLLRGERHWFGTKWNKVAGLQGFSAHGVRLGPDGGVWVGTETHGLARLKVRTGRVEWFGERQGLRAKDASTLSFDSENRLWVATDVGLFVAAAPYTRFSHVTALPSTRIWAIAEGSDGTIWAGNGDGLYALAGGRWKHFTREDGLSRQEVLSLGVGANGTIWIGYDLTGGIDRVHLQPGGLAVEKGVQRPGTEGLVYFLKFDPSGRLWAGTEQGVDMWDGSRWSHFDTGDGLAWNDCNLNAFVPDPDGTVWIGTSGGLSHFSPRPHLRPNAPLNVVFTRLLMGRTDFSDQSEPTSAIHANSLVAGYSALNASRENGVLFRYRLEGAHSNWTETPHRELQFAELAPGAYRLQIEAREGNGAWSAHRAEFAFTIPTPWYLSWWIMLLCGLIPIFAGWGVVRLRLANLARREREFQRLKAAHDEIRNLAFYDPLTALPNRRLLLDRLEQALTADSSDCRLRALLFVDLDNFKVLNDTLGHQIGDLLLREVARRLINAIREGDTVARLGGDEFVVMLEELSDIPEVAAAQAEIVAEKMLAVVSKPYLLADRECLSTCSIGVTVFGANKESVNEVLQQGDIAMYQAKAAGRNTARFFAPALQAAVNARAAMEADLRQAIKTNQFLLYYQPQVKDGRPFGAEALVRWKHPKRGILSPLEFIPLAEETGMILLLGDWVLQAACRQIAEWAEEDETAHITVAINISARQFRQPDFVERVLMAVARSGANPHMLKLELTESVLVDNVEDVIAKMTELKAAGLCISLDDFGTGYSSLAYLKRLPLDQLKIDHTFVRDILADATSGAIAQTIISLSRAMGLSVIAEGVESEEQRRFLAHLGCHAFQGFLFSRPLPLLDFERLLHEEWSPVSQDPTDTDDLGLSEHLLV